MFYIKNFYKKSLSEPQLAMKQRAGRFERVFKAVFVTILRIHCNNIMSHLKIGLSNQNNIRFPKKSGQKKPFFLWAVEEIAKK